MPITLLILSLFLLFYAVFYFLQSTLRGAIYYPTTLHNVELMLKIADLKPNQNIADIGSGDGRIVIACAKQNIYATGYEINPLLVFLSRYKIRNAKLEKYAKIKWESFWKIDFKNFDAVFIYGIPYIMNELENKLKQELKPESKIISNIFKFPNWKPKYSLEDKVHLYILKNKKATART